MTLKAFAEKMRVRVQEKAGDHYEVNLERSLGNNGTEKIRLTVKKDSDSNTAPAVLSFRLCGKLWGNNGKTGYGF